MHTHYSITQRVRIVITTLLKLRGLKNKTFRFNNSALIDANLLSRSICKHVAAENQFIHISN